MEALRTSCQRSLEDIRKEKVCKVLPCYWVIILYSPHNLSNIYMPLIPSLVPRLSPENEALPQPPTVGEPENGAGMDNFLPFKLRIFLCCPPLPTHAHTLQEMLERQLEYERVRLEAESRKACLESQEKVSPP